MGSQGPAGSNSGGNDLRVEEAEKWTERKAKE